MMEENKICIYDYNFRREVLAVEVSNLCQQEVQLDQFKRTEHVHVEL